MDARLAAPVLAAPQQVVDPPLASFASRVRRRHLLLIALWLLTISIVVSTPAHAAGTVTDCSAYDDGNAGDGADTLAEALSGGGIVTFNCSGTIIVPEITLDNDVTIDAAGQTVALDGGGTNRVFFVSIGKIGTLNNLTIRNGSAGSSLGGGIENRGTLNIANSTFSDNRAAEGAGIANLGSFARLDITKCTFSGNIDGAPSTTAVSR
jgi:hypothetical protein